ncbi:aspartyl-phosphate phosphatase Spo0E family protein [Paenibacillaceae bacterium]|nr:aspartyl-phosphate phosphatase Spo0E family protein [Paenibacillaceae bacterium]
MAKELEKLMEQIEQLRSELHELIKNRSFTDPEVISASQMLDAVLNEYQNIVSKRKS